MTAVADPLKKLREDIKIARDPRDKLREDVRAARDPIENLRQDVQGAKAAPELAAFQPGKYGYAGEEAPTLYGGGERAMTRARAAAVAEKPKPTTGYGLIPTIRQPGKAFEAVLEQRNRQARRWGLSETRRPPEPPGLLDAAGRGAELLVGGGAQAVSMMAGAVDRLARRMHSALAEVSVEVEYRVGAISKARYNQKRRAALRGDFDDPLRLKEVSDATAKWYAERPHLRPTEPKDIKGIVESGVAVVPQIAAFLGIHAVGGPPAAMATMYALGNKELYDEAKRRGMSEKQANLVADLGAVPYVGLEYFQMKGFAKLLPGVSKKTIADSILRTTVRQVGRGATMEVVATGAKESLEEMAQEALIVFAPTIATGGRLKPPEDWAERVAEAGMTMIPATGVIGGPRLAGAAARGIARAAPAKPALATAKEMRQKLGAPAEPTAEISAPTRIAAEAEAAVPEEVPAAPAEKQPWEMTREEWLGEIEKTEIDYTGGQGEMGMGRATKPGSFRTGIERRTFLRSGIPDQRVEGLQIPADHKNVVDKAFAEGKPVPPEVLADYPELKPAAPAEKAAVKKAETKAKRTVRGFLGDEAGAVDMAPLIEAGKQIRTATEAGFKMFTRFTGLDVEVRKVLLEHEEARVSVDREAALATTTVFKGVSLADQRRVQTAVEHQEIQTLPTKLQRIAHEVEAVNALEAKRMKEMGFLEKGPWPANRIGMLQEELATAEKEELPDTGKERKLRRARLEEIKGAIKELEGLAYVHRVVKREGKAKHFYSLVRRSRRITKKPAGMLGRVFPTIEAAEEAGYEVEPLAIAHAHMLKSMGRAWMNYKLIEAINENPDLSLPTKQAPSEWVQLDPRIFPYGQNRRYQPVLADAIKELTWVDTRHGLERAYDAVNVSMKMIGFYNPLVMTKNDLLQGWRAAGFKFFWKLPVATISVWHKDAQYQELRKAGLFSGVMNWRPAAEAVVEDMIRQMEKSKGERAVRWAGRQVRHPVKFIQKFNQLTTWKMDEVLRTAAFYGLRDGYFIGMKGRYAKQGMSEFEIAELANDFLANYGKVPRQTRRILNKTFFTPTYRISMKRILAKMWLAPEKHWPSLVRHYAWKLFVWYVLPGLTALHLGRKWWDAYSELGYRIVVGMPNGQEVVFTLADPLLEEAKHTQRPLIQSIRYELAAVPNMLAGLFEGPRWKDTRDKFGHIFKLGTPFWRDVVRMTDEDKTTAEKILTQLHIAYVYKRRARGGDNKISATALLQALSLWADWKEHVEFTKRKIGLAEEKPKRGRTRTRRRSRPGR